MSKPQPSIDDLVNEAVTQGMIAMQLSMSDGEPGRHKKVLRDTKRAFKKAVLYVIGDDEDELSQWAYNKADETQKIVIQGRIHNNSLRAEQRKRLTSIMKG